MVIPQSTLPLMGRFSKFRETTVPLVSLSKTCVSGAVGRRQLIIVVRIHSTRARKTSFVAATVHIALSLMDPDVVHHTVD
jgi:hypothetical protein